MRRQLDRLTAPWLIVTAVLASQGGCERRPFMKKVRAAFATKYGGERMQKNSRLGGPQRFAVAIPLGIDGASSVYESTLCTVLANLENSLRILAKSFSSSVTHAIVLTTPTSLSERSRRFFREAKVIVHDVVEADRREAFPDARRFFQAIKVHAVRLVAYDAVLVHDVDLFLLHDFDARIMLRVSRFDRRWVLLQGAYSPINAGIFVVAPARDLALRLDAALARGYSPLKFWGGVPYPPDVVALGAAGPSNHLWSSQWGFFNADSDQGLILHLIACEDQPPASLIERRISGTRHFRRIDRPWLGLGSEAAGYEYEVLAFRNLWLAQLQNTSGSERRRACDRLITQAFKDHVASRNRTAAQDIREQRMAAAAT